MFHSSRRQTVTLSCLLRRHVTSGVCQSGHQRSEKYVALDPPVLSSLVFTLRRGVAFHPPCWQPITQSGLLTKCHALLAYSWCSAGFPCIVLYLLLADYVLQKTFSGCPPETVGSLHTAPGIAERLLLTC